MKNYKIIFFYILFVLTTYNVKAQNADPSLSVQTSNAGVVEVGAINDITVTLSNNLSGNIPQGRMRPIVSVPPSVTFLENSLQTGLPTGFTIVSNSGSQLRVCNSSTNLAGFGLFSIILKVRGVTIAPATTVQGQFNPGTNCANGPNIAGDVPGNNAPTTTIQVVAATVPLTLTSFTSSIINCIPRLTWVTENEVNTARFEIEKSNNNSNDWKKIGELAANGNSSTKLTYHFNDVDNDAAIEKVFYKLKMIDVDGRFTYSPIIPVNSDCKNATINVYPNPVVGGKLNIKINGVKGIAILRLYTLTGQTILQSNVNNGLNNISVNALTEGIYLLNVKDQYGFDKNLRITVNR